MGRIAAIDFGLKRIGIALSDERKCIAFPLITVEGGKKAISHIQAALQGKEVELIVIGLPLLMSGQKAEMATLVEAFAKEIEATLHIPTCLLDERLSSRQAELHLKEMSLNRKERTGKIDTVAATLLLQTYLDQKK